MSFGKILIMDTGPFSYIAPFMARYYDKVYYHRLSGGPYLESSTCHIGEGLPGVTWLQEPWQVMDKVDVIFFPDICYGSMQMFLKSKGLPVCGSLGGGKLETDKAYFLEVLQRVGLPVAKTYRADGLTDLWEYVKDKPGPLYMKNADRERGDWETKPHLNKWQTQKIIDEARQRLGERAETIEILVQNKIDAECEFGIDTFQLDGKIPQKVCGGYEDKDEAYVGTVFDECPKIVKDIQDKLEPEYRKLGYAGPYSNEIRITSSGKAYPIDETCRCASPPTASLLTMLGEDYARAIYDLAHGKLPVIGNPDYKYCAELILSSKWHKDNELHVGSAKDVEKYGIFAKNAICQNGQIYCIPNGDDEIFGSIVSGHKNNWQAAVDDVLEKAKALNIYQLDCDYRAFDRIGDKIKSGEKHGIHF